jgi:hypothetical protein
MICTRGRGAVYGEVWYAETPPADASVDILVYRQRATPVADARYAPTMLLLTDLTKEEDAIAADFDTTCRYHIRRAGKSDGVSLQYIEDPEPRLEEFRAFYDDFANEKSLYPADMKWLVGACRAKQLAFTVAMHEGEPLVWHAYVIFGNSAGLQYSCSCFRNREREFRSRVARANRWLHWQDMLQLKARGITRYDWGGLFSDESTPERFGINNFKRSFGPKPLRAYDCTVPLTLRGRLWLPLREAWRRRQPLRPRGGGARLPSRGTRPEAEGESAGADHKAA